MQGRQKAGAGKRARYTLICMWADFLGIPRNRYTLASIRIIFTSSHASTCVAVFQYRWLKLLGPMMTMLKCLDVCFGTHQICRTTP